MGLGGRPEPSQGAEKLINRPSGDGGGGSVLPGSRGPKKGSRGAADHRLPQPGCSGGGPTRGHLPSERSTWGPPLTEGRRAAPWATLF